MWGKLHLMTISGVALAEGTRPRLCLGTSPGHRGTEHERTNMARRFKDPVFDPPLQQTNGEVEPLNAQRNSGIQHKSAMRQLRVRAVLE
jgi:hypothetical protein